MATLYLELSHDEALELPYKIIAETSSRSIWDTGKRKRMMSERFDESERACIRHIVNKSKRWMFVTGVPIDGVKMTIKTRTLWHRLAEFCASL